MSLEDELQALSGQIEELSGQIEELSGTLIPRLIASLDNLAGVIEAEQGGSGGSPDE
jgi:hypothetical protein